jgi:hypothetical protein
VIEAPEDDTTLVTVSVGVFVWIVRRTVLPVVTLLPSPPELPEDFGYWPVSAAWTTVVTAVPAPPL